MFKYSPSGNRFAFYFLLMISTNLKDDICLPKWAATADGHSIYIYIYMFILSRNHGKAMSRRIPSPPCYSLMVACVSFNSFSRVILASSMGDF